MGDKSPESVCLLSGLSPKWQSVCPLSGLSPKWHINLCREDNFSRKMLFPAVLDSSLLPPTYCGLKLIYGPGVPPSVVQTMSQTSRGCDSLGPPSSTGNKWSIFGYFWCSRLQGNVRCRVHSRSRGTQQVQHSLFLPHMSGSHRKSVESGLGDEFVHDFSNTHLGSYFDIDPVTLTYDIDPLKILG